MTKPNFAGALTCDKSTTTLSSMKIITQGGFGPKMKALPNDNWRDFVLLYCAQGRHQASRAYAEVYDRPLPEQQNTNRVEAYRLVHDERVQDAILEVCQRT